MVSFILPGNSASGGYEVANSLRFERSSSDYLSKTFGSGGNRKTATQSFWFKRSLLSTNMMLGLTIYPGGSYYGIQALTDDVLDIYLYHSGSAWEGRLKTNRKFRDTNAWYHFVLSWDTTQSTASNRFKLYVNGVQETSFQIETYPNQNQDLDWNNNIAHQIMSGGGGTFSGYLAEFVFIDGQQLTPSSFGETDSTTGIWKPKKINKIANAGTNSFYLDFKDSSNLGNDASGLNNDFAVTNLTSIDQTTDTCVENFCILNTNMKSTSNVELSEGNLKAYLNQSTGWQHAAATFAVKSGKWYWEAKATTVSAVDKTSIGVFQFDTTDVDFVGNTNADRSSKGLSGHGAGTGGYSYAQGDIIMCAMDLDNNKIYWGKNGTYFGTLDPANGTGSTTQTVDNSNFCVPAVGGYGGSIWELNFGVPQFTVSSGNSDANGHGNFEYAVPSGFYALNSSNLNTYG